MDDQISIILSMQESSQQTIMSPTIVVFPDHDGDFGFTRPPEGHYECLSIRQLDMLSQMGKLIKRAFPENPVKPGIDSVLGSKFPVYVETPAAIQITLTRSELKSSYVVTYPVRGDMHTDNPSDIRLSMEESTTIHKLVDMIRQYNQGL